MFRGSRQDYGLQKKVVIILLSVFASIGLLSCANSEASKDSGNGNETGAIENPETHVDEKQGSKAVFEYHQKVGSFSEGLAWIKYNDGEGDAWGCIDKGGKMQFAVSVDSLVLPESIDYAIPTKFSNGCAYIAGAPNPNSQEGSVLWVISKSGQVLSCYSNEGSEKVAAYGDGYVATQELSDGFESSAWIYRIYDSEGNLIEEFSHEGKWSAQVNYCGKGVFAFYNKADLATDFYFANSQKHLVLDAHYDSNTKVVKFYDDIATLTSHGINIGNNSIALISKEGVIEEVSIPEGLHGIWDVTINDDLCLVRGGTKLGSNRGLAMSVYDRSNGVWITLDEKYASMVKADKVATSLVFKNERLPLVMEGDDGKTYMAVFDGNLDIAFEPVKEQWAVGGYSDNRLVTRTAQGDIYTVYDEGGVVVFSFLPDEHGCESLLPFSDGVACAEPKENENWMPQYFDSEGNTLFEKIDDSSVKMVVID